MAKEDGSNKEQNNTTGILVRICSITNDVILSRFFILLISIVILVCVCVCTYGVFIYGTQVNLGLFTKLTW